MRGAGVVFPENILPKLCGKDYSTYQPNKIPAWEEKGPEQKYRKVETDDLRARRKK